MDKIDDEAVNMVPVFDFDESLYADLTENLHLLKQYIDRFPKLEKTSRREDGIFTVAQFRDRVTTLTEKPWVVVTGHFDAGKSHLCNSSFAPIARTPLSIRLRVKKENNDKVYDFADSLSGWKLVPESSRRLRTVL